MSSGVDDKEDELARVAEERAFLYDSGEVEAQEAEGTIFKNQFSHKLNKMILEFLGLWCHIDLLAVETPPAQLQNARIETPPVRMFGVQVIRLPSIGCHNSISSWRREARKKLWPYVLILLWLVSTLHIVNYLYHQYAYDYHLFRLARVRWLNRTQVENQKSLEREDYLLEQLAEWARRLERIGAPSLHLSFALECVHLLLLLGPIVLYFQINFYFTWSSPFNFYFIRNFFSYTQEQRRNEQFVRAHVRNFVNSIRNWSCAILRESTSNNLVMPTTSGLIKESHLCEQLEEMLAAGHLRPLNQRANWVAWWSPHYTWIICASYLYALSVDLLFFTILIGLVDKPLAELSLRTWTLICELAFLLILFQVSIVFYLTTLIFTCLDQVLLVNKLRKLLGLTIRLNNLRFCEANKRDNSVVAISQGKSTQMNGDIMLVLMHYRIFVTQLMNSKNSLSIIAAAGVYLMFIIQLLGRLHVPYFEPHSMQLTRSLVVGLGCTVILFTDIFLVPLCYLNKSCIDFYRELNYLLAHVKQITTLTNEQLTLDQQIIISTLRKELSYHDRVTSLLAIEFLGLKFTFGNLVRLHFYIGFIILSIMGENLAQLKETTGTIFTDPLGLF